MSADRPYILAATAVIDIAWGLQRLSAEQKRHLVELLDDWYGTRSPIATSQYPMQQWDEAMEGPTLTDVVLDRRIQIARNIDLVGESMRRKRSLWPSAPQQQK